jgi:DNA polymerase
MLQMAKPRRIEPDGTIVWWDDAGQAGEALRLLQAGRAHRARGGEGDSSPLPHEREIFLLDQRMNDRGVKIDRALIDAAQVIADIGVERANLVLRELTNGTVSEVTNHAKLTEWLQSQGVETGSPSRPSPSCWRATISRRTCARRWRRAPTPAGRRREAQKLPGRRWARRRVRGLLAYHVASTGRWGGRLVQPQNFPRGEVKGIEELIPLVLTHDYDLLRSSSTRS